jgi:hypothetical protein
MESPESADFNLVAGSQGADDAVKYGADDDIGFLVGQLDGLANLFGHVGPGHLAHLLCIPKKSITVFPVTRTPAAPDGRARGEAQSLNDEPMICGADVSGGGAAWIVMAFRRGGRAHPAADPDPGRACARSLRAGPMALALACLLLNAMVLTRKKNLIAAHFP